MANVISRLVRLVLDRAAARKMEQDAKQSLGGVERATSTLRAAFVRLGAVIAAAFGIRAIINFGRASIQAAKESEQVWNDLAGTIDAAGGSFAAMEESILATSKAFQDATIHGDEDYARVLTRLITLSGDLEASQQNVGLTANVAAQFFKGELAPAADLVAKVMNGNVTILQRMGIQVESAQEGLELLAERSMGAAERQTRTFGGALSQLNELWGDFQEEVGMALVGTEETTGAIDVLDGVIRTLTASVIENQDALRSWVGTGLRWVVEGLDAVYRTLRGLGELIVGPFFIALGGLVRGFALFGQGAVLAQEALGGFLRAIGATNTADNIDQMTDRLRANTEAIIEWAANARAVGRETFMAGLNRFATPSFDFGAGRVRPGLDTGSPMLGKNAKGEDVKEEDPAKFERDEFAQAVFDAERRITELRNRRRQMFAEGEADVQKILDDFDMAVADAPMWATIMGQEFNALETEADLLRQALQDLSAAGMQGTDVWEEKVGRLRQVQHAIDETAKSMKTAGEVADVFGSLVAGALGAGIPEIAKAKARQNAILAAEQLAHAIVSALNPFTAGRAAGHLVAAGKFTAIAGAWAALGGATGGGVAGGGSPAASARGASGASAERAQPPGAEVHIYMEGHLNGMDINFQRATMIASQQARERYGENAKVILHRKSA